MQTSQEGAQHEVAEADPSFAPTYGAKLFMPVMSLEEALERRDTITQFIERGFLREGRDWSTLTDNPKDDRKLLLKAGAEKLGVIFGFVPRYSIVSKVEHWDASGESAEALLAYHVKCELFRDGIAVGEGEGSCNSRETRYRWRWVTPEDWEAIGKPKKYGTRSSTKFEFDFAINKAETTGKYGKPQSYWDEFKAAIAGGKANKVVRKFRNGNEGVGWEIPSTLFKIGNPEVADLQNTILKMASKRAHVAAIITAIGASDIFTQDLDDFEGKPPGSGQSYAPPEEGSGDAQENAPPAGEDAPQEKPLSDRDKALALTKEIAAMTNLSETTDPPAKAILDICVQYAKVEGQDSPDPKAVLEKLEKLKGMGPEKALKFVESTWEKINSVNQEEPKMKPPAAPAAKKSSPMDVTAFKTLNIPGMIVQLARRVGPQSAPAIRQYIKDNWELDGGKIPGSHDEIEAALVALFELDDDALRESLGGQE